MDIDLGAEEQLVMELCREYGITPSVVVQKSIQQAYRLFKCTREAF
jgi:hypothetical protein